MRGNYNYFLPDDPVLRDRRLDSIVADFEKEWKSGELHLIERYIATVESAHRPSLLSRLLPIELKLRREHGEAPTIEEFRLRFPSHRSVVEEHFLLDATAATTNQAPVTDHGSTTTATTDPNAPAESVVSTVPHRDQNPLHLNPTWPVTADQLVGSTLGRLKLTGVIGKGGMGVVYRAEHTLIKHTVAVKVLSPRLVGNPEAVERFLREAQACVQLVHPHVVTVFDVGIDDATGLAHMTMQLIDGENLEHYVRDNGPLPPGEAVRLVRQVAEALQFAYARDRPIVHRDIKPSNIMRDSSGNAKLLDLGLARVLGDDTSEFGLATDDPLDDDASIVATRMTKRGALLGTIPYMAPEQARSAADADVRSDIYSLGCTLYYLLTGVRPVPGDSTDETLANVLAGRRIPLVDQLGDRHDPSLARIVERMTAFDLKDRPQTPADLIADLNAWERTANASVFDVNSISIEELRDRLVEVGLITMADWQAIVRQNSGPLQTYTTVSFPHTFAIEGQTNEYTLPTKLANATDALLRLQRLRRGASLTDFQVKQIMAGNIDRLRFGNRIVLTQLGATPKGELFKVQNRDVANRHEVIRTLGLWTLPGLQGSLRQCQEKFLETVDEYSAIRHSTLQTIYECGLVDENVGFIASEFIDGKRLIEARLADTRREEISRLLLRCIDVLDGLNALHSFGLLHLDVSPYTLWIGWNGNAKLVDAGLRRLKIPSNPTSSQTPPTSRSPVGVLAPEQWLNYETVGIATELFNWGATVYYLLTGVFPYLQDFEPAHLADDVVIEKVKSATIDVPLAREFHPPSMRPIFAKLLSPDPRARYDSAAALLDDLAPIRREILAKSPDREIVSDSQAIGWPQKPARWKRQSAKQSWWQFWKR